MVIIIIIMIVQETEELAECETDETQTDINNNVFCVPLDNSEPEYHDTPQKIQEGLASLLLWMQAVLHVSKLATQ